MQGSSSVTTYCSSSLSKHDDARLTVSSQASLSFSSFSCLYLIFCSFSNASISFFVNTLSTFFHNALLLAVLIRTLYLPQFSSFPLHLHIKYQTVGLNLFSSPPPYSAKHLNIWVYFLCFS